MGTARGLCETCGEDTISRPTQSRFLEFHLAKVWQGGLDLGVRTLRGLPERGDERLARRRQRERRRRHAVRHVAVVRLEAVRVAFVGADARRLGGGGGG